jgi:hypothetical protein
MTMLRIMAVLRSMADAEAAAAQATARAAWDATARDAAEVYGDAWVYHY